jgi:hypothetical protein
MNANERDDDPLLEWALQERLGGEKPPDLAGAVRTQLAREPVPPRSFVAAPVHRLAVAALVLLGALVVVGVALWPRERGVATQPVPAPQDPQPRAAPKPVQVDMLTDVATLPLDTRAIEAVAVHDVKLAELECLRDLEVLVIRDPVHEAFGLSPKVAPPRQHWLVTGNAWPTIARFSKLRRLELSGIALAGYGLTDQVATAGFAQLERLPLLESLTLRCCDTPDELLAVLPRLRALRHLDLSFNHGFEADGVDAIVQCTGLRSLSLRGCQQLHDRVLAKVAALPDLERLDLSLIDGINWQVGPDTPRSQPLTALRDRARKLADRLGMGPGEETFRALGAARRLRSLDVSGGHWSTRQLALLGGAFVNDGVDGALLDDVERVVVKGAVLRATGGHFDGEGFVASLPKSLERLEVGGRYTDAFCTAVAAHLTSLRHLNVAACDRITDAGVATLAAMPSLRALDLRQMRGLSSKCIDALAGATQLEELDLRHNDFVTAEHVVRLRRALPRLRSLQTSVPDDALRALTRPSDPPRVASRADVDALPAGVRAVIAERLGRATMAALVEHRSIEHLELRSSDVTVIPTEPRGALARSGEVAGAFAELERLPRLRRLTLGTLDGLGDDVFAVAARFPALRELDLSGAWVSERALADLVRLPLTTLVWRRGHMPSPDAPKQLAAMSTLRELVIEGGPALAADALASFAALENLQRLTLARIPGVRIELPVGERLVSMRVGGPGDGHGVTHDVVVALARLPRLEALDLTGAELRVEGLRALHRLASLRRLAGVPGTTALLQHLPPQLQELDLREMELERDFGDTLARATPALRRIDLSGNRHLTDDALASLQRVASLRELDVSGCDGLTEAAGDVLARITQLESVTVGRTRLQLEKVRAMPNLKFIEADTFREVLRR